MKIGIIGAMDVEVSYLKRQLTDTSVTTHGGMEFCEGRLEGVPAVVVKCGVGKVNAALCVQVLTDLFGITCVINTGVAGSLDSAIGIGDIVVSTDAVEHDYDVSPLGYAPGQVPGFDVLAFPADGTLRETAIRAVAQAAPDVRAFEGRVASGDQFIAGGDQRERITAVFRARCAEMEGAAIAHAAYVNGLPFVVIRAISDRADGTSTMDYAAFERVAARHCAQIVRCMVSLLKA